MAEVLSLQAARAGAGATGYGKRLPTDQGKVQTILVTAPAGTTWASGDTVASGVSLPVGSRFLSTGQMATDAMGAGITADVGLRNFATKAVIDADGIGAAVNMATSTVRSVQNGAFLSAMDYVTTEPAEVYVTLAGGTPTANTRFRLELQVLIPG